jgi:hypothetical protein
MGREAKAALWRQRVEAFERSGLSLRAWCARTGFAVSTLDAWRRRVRKMPKTALVPIVVEPPVDRRAVAASIEVEASGLRVYVPTGTDPTWICAVLRGLRP